MQLLLLLFCFVSYSSSLPFNYLLAKALVGPKLVETKVVVVVAAVVVVVAAAAAEECLVLLKAFEG